MRVLVCGGRDYEDKTQAWACLSVFHSEKPIACLIAGAAQGADRLATGWANANAVPSMQFPANWLKHGRAAGPIRNQRMLEEGKPDVVIAFPGGAGTADMVRRARAAGVEVREVSPLPEAFTARRSG